MSDHLPPAPAPMRSGNTGRIFATMFLVVTGIAQVGFGIAALAHIGYLTRHIHEIERDPRYGTVYFGLTTWGILLIVIGLGQFWSGTRLGRHAPGARLFALAACMFGLALGFFTLALFHLAALGTVIVALMALYTLSYRVDD